MISISFRDIESPKSSKQNEIDVHPSEPLRTETSTLTNTTTFESEQDSAIPISQEITSDSPGPVWTKSSLTEALRRADFDILPRV